MVTLWDKATYPNPGDDPDMEIILVTAVSGTTFTITRAQEGTTGVAHASGEAVEMLITAGHFTEIEQSHDFVNIERDLGCVPHVFTTPVATDNTTKINTWLANAGANGKMLFVPGKPFAINDTLEIPAVAGGTILGVGPTKDDPESAYGVGKKIGDSSRFVWLGATSSADATKAMINIQGAMWTIDGIQLQGANWPTQSASPPDWPNRADRVAIGIQIKQHANGGTSRSWSGKERINAGFFLVRTAIRTTHDPANENQADESYFEWLNCFGVETVFESVNQQSSAHHFGHIIVYADLDTVSSERQLVPTTIFKVKRGGPIHVDNLNMNTTGTVLELGDASGNAHVDRNCGVFVIDEFRLDASAPKFYTDVYPFRLIDYKSANVAAFIRIRGTFAHASFAGNLHRPWVNPDVSLVTLSSPTASLKLAAPEAYMPATLTVVNGASEGVSFNSSTRNLQVTVNISGGNNTVQHLVNVLENATLYSASVVTNGGSTISASTAGTAALTSQGAPLVNVWGNDSDIELDIWGLDAVTAAKYPPKSFHPIYAPNGNVPLFQHPSQLVPAIIPSDSVKSLLQNGKLWLEADDLDSTNVSGGLVGSWDDLSSTGNHLSQAAAGNKPALLQNVLHHRPGADWAANDEFMERTNPTGLGGIGDFTAIIVFEANDFNPSGYNMLLTYGNWHASTGQAAWDIGVSGGKPFVNVYTNGITVVTSDLHPDVIRRYGSGNLLIVRRKASSNSIQLTLNGVTMTDTSFTTSNTHTPAAGQKLLLGAQSVNGSVIRSWYGAMSFAFFDDDYFSDADFYNLTDYVRAKYGVN